MKKLRNTIMIVTIFIGGVCLGACKNNVSADTVKNFSIERDCRIGQSNIDILTDKETGVQYIVIASQYSDSDGFDRQGISITPRLRADGSLYFK
jgi:hypothetical protein